MPGKCFKVRDADNSDEIAKVGQLTEVLVASTELELAICNSGDSRGKLDFALSVAEKLCSKVLAC